MPVIMPAKVLRIIIQNLIPNSVKIAAFIKSPAQNQFPE